MLGIRYSDELGDEICQRLVEGETLVTICKSKHIPSRSVIRRWLDEQADFAYKYDRAREMQGDYVDHQIDEIAKVITSDTARADDVRIRALQWRARCLDSRTKCNR